ncbi:MAG TPA: putative nucleotidyltransferase substrate binding domain-containing protein [Solirubrobacteraceae bacterium]
MTSEEARQTARFLRAHPPFDALAADAVERVAAQAELESYSSGDVVFGEGAAPVRHLRVIRSGVVELATRGRVLDMLVEGDVFGHGSLLSGLPTAFSARAVEDSTCYRIPGEEARALLSGPAGVTFVARSLLEEPTELHILAREPAVNTADEPVGSLVRGDAVVCAPDSTIREAVELMSAGPGTAVVVALGSDGFGILTDRDLRTKVIAGGMSVDDPVSAAMSVPAYTCTADQRAGEVLAEMFDRGLRHFPVLSATGQIVGVVEDVDLVALRTRSSFWLRQRIATARSDEELVTVSRELRPMVVSLFDAGVAAANVMSVYAVCVDALTRRLLKLALDRRAGVAPEFAWLALGSQARREALPGSDVDSAIVWFQNGGEVEEQTRAQLLDLAREVIGGLRACGLRTDENGVTADAAPFVRSVSSWQHVAQSWMSDPTQDKALILTSVLVDNRPVWGVHTGNPVADTFRMASSYPRLLRMLARFALSHRPAARRFRGLVVDQGGAYPGTLDLKAGGLVPIVDLARWGAMTAGVTSATTPERLRAAAEAGTLAPADAHTLQDAFELVNNLRLEHQVEQMRAGRRPDDHVDPEALSSLMRIQLRQALRAVATIQKRVAAELDAGRHAAGATLR